MLLAKPRSCLHCGNVKNLEEFSFYKTDYFKTYKICLQKLDLPSAKDQNNENKFYQNNENDFFLNNIFELDNLEEFISTKLEAFNRLNGLVKDLEKEIANSNNYHLLAVHRNIQKTLKIAKDIKEYCNCLSNIQT
ncbi:28895_t:CDS:2 [Dentiscutata erythropus]|uniref:28895_t:CDS:1 n=1 Tax=Dentiscutata erythropus TaxID=1348616 RepID=A0A9N9AUS9_9GLOM|nr:28895_t:CDS:2 [Dentiscutata erythropus]